MKKITLKLASLTLAVIMLMSVMPFSTFAADDFNSAQETSATTKTYDFSDSSQLDDFYSYYWSKNENGQIRDTSVTDSYKLENGILTRTRDYHAWNGGWLDHITALTFKDVEFKNFDLSFEMQYNVGDNGCAKFFYVGMREVLPGQPGQAVGPDCWWGNKDSNGNTTNNIYINLYGKTSLDYGSEDAVAGVENTYGKMCKYRVRAVGTTVSVWVFDTTGEPDYTFTEADGIIDRTGTLSLCFLDTLGSIDNISITNLDDNGNEAAFPVASTKRLKKNMAAKTSTAKYYRDFMTETWENVDGKDVYTTYSDLNSAAYAYDDWNLLTSDLGHIHGYSADNMAALTLNDSRLANFEATVTMRFLNSGLPCCGNFAINMREQEPGKLFRTTWNDTDAWPPIATMSDGTYTVALATSADSTEVNVWNTSHTTVATRTAEDFSTMHTYKVKLVGDTLYTWVDGVQAETVSGLALEDRGYISFISSNQRVVISDISITWLDEDGNPAEWGTEPKTVDSTREWFGEGNSMDLSEFRASYWDSDNGYVSTVPAIIGGSDASWKADTFWKNTGWYTLEPLYDNRYGDTTFTDGSWADNMTALTLNDNSFRNFEVEVSVTGYTGHFNPIMISAREKNPGQPVEALGSWSYGIQSDLTENVVLKYFVNDSNATITSGSNVAEIAGIVTGDYEYKTNNLKLRVVGDTATVWVNDSNQGTLQLSENCEESGYISIIFANVAGAINNLKVTRLGEDGSPIDYNTGKQLFINNADDLAKIGKNVAYPADGNYWLTNDIIIDESNPWTSVAEFSGSLNGDGHTIKGLTNALIHTTTGDATVSNLIIEDINSSNTGDYIFKGTVIRHVKGTAKIENVAVTGYISNNFGGAFVGCVDNDCKLTINNCSYKGTMLMSYMGGFVGKCYETAIIIINNSFSDFTVEWAEYSWNYAVDNAPVTVNNSYYKRNIGSIDTNYSDAKSLATLGLPSEYWVHNGKIPQLKITGAENFIAGDVNLDKTINIIDLVAMKKLSVNIPGVNSSTLAANLDNIFDESGVATVSASDLAILRRILLGINN